MNNESDYLWDKTGEPDPKVQELEEILGTLRYQPRPLSIPESVSVGGKRSFFRSATPSLAIAATIVMLLLGLGVWLGWQRLQKGEPAPQARQESVAPATASTPNTKSVVASSPIEKPNVVEEPHRSLPRQTLLAVRGKRVRNEAVNPEIAARKLREAEVAKDQLMMAFRLVSAKLNYAQKKTQELNQRDQVHNQHKIG
jgi:predicted negative regulator of RcsB-dependent stress response